MNGEQPSLSLVNGDSSRVFCDFDQDINPGLFWGNGLPVIFKVLFHDQPPGVEFLSNRPLEDDGQTELQELHPETLHYDHWTSIAAGEGPIRVFSAINSESAGGVGLYTAEGELLTLNARLVLPR